MCPSAGPGPAASCGACGGPLTDHGSAGAVRAPQGGGGIAVRLSEPLGGRDIATKPSYMSAKAL